MERFDTIFALRQYLQTTRQAGRRIGLVPTMGALHDGHLSLIEAARQGDRLPHPASGPAELTHDPVAKNQVSHDLVVCSIFVNPTQFNNPEDLARYPRTLDDDCRLLEAAGCDVVFAPSVDEMYLEQPTLRLQFGELETSMEGAFRPGHFNGVGIVVAKLFHMVQPDVAYFGQKDLQQVAVVRRLIRDLSFPISLIRCDTVREADGLAMSSRNRLLSPDERQQATTLFKALSLARELMSEGHSTVQAKAAVTNLFVNRPEFRLEYVDVVNADTLRPVAEQQAPGQTAICLAAQLGQVRLIDNLVF
ncbi:pantoate--beta-alanine ligase [Nibrella viscosa]|uniref:Pantothenate synthetase n=1 Tax=Nibrella viscosa TaxID=1084524 RepID=A0ABP8K212_9BACT